MPRSYNLNKMKKKSIYPFITIDVVQCKRYQYNIYSKDHILSRFTYRLL